VLAASGFLLIACAAAVVGGTALAAQTPAMAGNLSGTVLFRIDAQSANEALKQFASQANVQLVYESRDIDPAIHTPSLAGSFTPEEALTRLLAHTNLEYRFINTRTVSIRYAEAAVAASTNSFSDQTRQKITAGGDNNALEEVIVTAQKREEKLIDVPMSIVALSGDDLQQRQLISVDDLSSAVPGLSMESNGYQRRIEIRGISNGGSNGNGNSSLIGMYLDEADVTSYATTQLDLGTYDLQRVEVLRGPQGTLYGDGSAGGTIRFISRNPDLKSFAFAADEAATFTEDGEPGQRGNAMVNAPIIDDVLGVRFVGRFENGGGWIDQPAADRRNFNGQSLAEGRLKALWQPLDRLTVSALADIHRNSTAPGIGEDASGNYTQVFGLTTTPHVDDNFDIYNLTLTYDLDAFRILSTSTWVRQNTQTRDLGYVIPLGAGIAPYLLYDPPSFAERSDSINEELRLTSNGAGPLQWTLGAYYRRFLFDYDLAYYLGQGSLDTAFFVPDRTRSLSKSWATFGDASYKITERFTVGAGLRYYKDDQDFTGIDPEVATQTGSFHSTSPRGYAQFKAAENLNLYASAAKGFRSGGFNSLNQPSYGPENVWTYEFGAKTVLLDNRLRTNLALFYSDYKDYQVVGLLTAQSPVNIVYNAGTARIKGAEWDSTWRPVEQWTFGFSANYMDTKFTRIIAQNTGITVGDRIGLVPDYQFSLSVQRDFKWGTRSGFARLDYNQVGNEINNGTPGSESNVLNLLNFNASLYVNDNLRLGIFAMNLFNDRGHTDPLEVYTYAARERPRTYGLQFGVDFH
jgi:outer membrane receptor protein involved in Fe transport